METKPSPLSKLKAVAPILTSTENSSLPVPTSTVKSPLGTAVAQRNIPTSIISITDDDVERLGADSRQKVKLTTDKVIGKMTMGKFDELGEMLNNVRFEVSRLDPASIAKTGLSGWFQDKFTDFRKLFSKQFETASKAFDELEVKMNNHIAVETEWVRDLEQLYKENYEAYRNLMDDISKAEEVERQLVESIKNYPVPDVSDPDAPMKMQARSRAEATLNRLRIRMDSFIRSKAMAENNAPKIMNQIETARTSIMVLRDTIQDAIPLIKMDFVTYMASLDSKKALQVVQNSRQLLNDSAKKSADSAKEAAIGAATVLNTAALENDTLTHIRKRALETLADVGKIQQDAQAKRLADRELIAQGQRDYLQQLQQSGVV